MGCRRHAHRITHDRPDRFGGQPGRVRERDDSGGHGVGDVVIIARADDPNAIFESSEGNNTRTKSIVIGPDLVVTAVGAPATAARGANINVATVNRSGGGSTVSSTITRFFLSTDNLPGAGDVPLGVHSVPTPGPWCNECFWRYFRSNPCEHGSRLVLHHCSVG